jgi:hypothetical protein
MTNVSPNKPRILIAIIVIWKSRLEEVQNEDENVLIIIAVPSPWTPPDRSFSPWIKSTQHNKGKQLLSKTP